MNSSKSTKLTDRDQINEILIPSNPFDIIDLIDYYEVPDFNSQLSELIDFRDDDINLRCTYSIFGFLGQTLPIEGLLNRGITPKLFLNNPIPMLRSHDLIHELGKPFNIKFMMAALKCYGFRFDRNLELWETDKHLIAPNHILNKKELIRDKTTYIPPQFTYTLDNQLFYDIYQMMKESKTNDELLSKCREYNSKFNGVN